MAKEACDAGRVFVNDKQAKPGTELEIGDVIRVEFGMGSVTAKVTALTESPRKEDASSMYEIINQ